MHIFAISGLQIALIAAILISVLRVARVPRAACGWIVIPALWLCTGITGWQSSAIRSTLMVSIVVGGWALRRPGNLLNSLSAAGFLILLWEPEQLFQASFQLSFFVVLSMALLLPVFEGLRERWFHADPWLPAQLRPTWPAWLQWPIRFVSTSLATSLSAWLGSLPLIAYYFHLVTPISLLANLLIVPLSSLALMCNLGSFFCGQWLTPLTTLFNYSGWFWMELMIRLNNWLATVPGGYWHVQGPGFVGFTAYYLVVFAFITGWMFAPQRRRWVALGLGLLAAYGGWHYYHEGAETRITVLAVGGGDSIFIEAPGHRNDLLIDCGNASAAEYIVKPFLGARGVNRLSRCLLTHGDARHVAGAPLVVEDYSPREILTSSVRFRSPVYRGLLSDWEQSHKNIRTIKRGDQIGGMRVLHPDSQDRFPLADDNTVVLLGEVDGLRVLFCSDLGRLGQNALLGRTGDLRADIVVAGIPTRNEPLEDALIAAIQPKLVILSTAFSPPTESAKAPLRERLGGRGVPVIYTSDAGTVTLSIRPKKWEIRAMDGTKVSLGGVKK